MPEGKWAHSRIYEDINVGIAVGHAADFWDLPDDTQAYLIGRFRVEGIKQAYESYLQEQESKQRRNKAQSGPRGRR